MRISFSWLKKHVAIPESLTPTELAEKLKLSTVEVEGVDYAGAHLDKIVVGKVLSAEKHPNADSLQVCQVDTGAETVTIVCGGSNVVPNMYVAVAQTGAKVRWHGEGELIELKPAKIRGVESNGMICGADEIGLAERFPKKSEKEIVDLGSLKVRAGEPLAKVLNLSDAIFEIDNKSLSNRPDLWGHYGLAREVAALTGRPLQPYKTTEIKKGMVNEAKKLHASGLSFKRMRELGLEYRALADYLQNKITKEELIETIKKENWAYAKRQITWFKRDKNIRWINI
jgi:phenylalanyl-tRNA synthetase beta chain